MRWFSQSNGSTFIQSSRSISAFYFSSWGSHPSAAGSPRIPSPPPSPTLWNGLEDQADGLDHLATMPMPRSIRPLTGFKPSLDGSEADSSQSWKFWQRLNVHRIISRLLGWSWTVIGSPTTTKNPAGSLEECPNVWSVPTKNRPKMAGKNLETIETAIDWNRQSQNRGSKKKHQSINRQIDSILSIIQRWNGSTGSGRSGERSATVQQRRTPATFNQPIKMQIEMFQLKRIEIHLVVTATPSATLCSSSPPLLSYLLDWSAFREHWNF